MSSFDLEGLDVLKSDPLFSAGKGPTTVFSSASGGMGLQARVLCLSLAAPALQWA